MIVDRVYDLMTDDLFLRLPEYLADRTLFLKIEGLNPAGSVKLKTAVALITDAERRGTLRKGGRVVESSSGNLGIALSMVCAQKGYSFTCITDPKAPPQSVATMRALSAKVVVVTERDSNGGYLATRIALIEQMLADDPELVWPNQYANPANPQVHSDQTAAQILKAIKPVDYLFVGAGTTGTLTGCAAYFRAYSPHTRIIAVDAEGSVTFGRPAGPRYLPGLGTSRVPELCQTDNIDEIVYIPEAEAVQVCRRIAASQGLLIGGSSGSVLAAVSRLGDQIPVGSNVVAISPDLGDRYLDSIYDDEWITSLFGPAVLGGAPQPAVSQLGSLDAEAIATGTRFAAALDASAYLELACAQHNLETGAYGLFLSGHSAGTS